MVVIGKSKETYVLLKNTGFEGKHLWRKSGPMDAGHVDSNRIALEHNLH